MKRNLTLRNRLLQAVLELASECNDFVHDERAILLHQLVVDDVPYKETGFYDRTHEHLKETILQELPERFVTSIEDMLHKMGVQHRIKKHTIQQTVSEDVLQMPIDSLEMPARFRSTLKNQTGAKTIQDILNCSDGGYLLKLLHYSYVGKMCINELARALTEKNVIYMML